MTSSMGIGIGAIVAGLVIIGLGQALIRPFKTEALETGFRSQMFTIGGLLYFSGYGLTIFGACMTFVGGMILWL
ncbi:MAG: hypothetical protein HQK55_07720 [Deltaproteobacteria bacterium]|nr:hypothetical protein [Deltaproteobacteria bacterium]